MMYGVCSYVRSWLVRRLFRKVVGNAYQAVAPSCDNHCCSFPRAGPSRVIVPSPQLERSIEARGPDAHAVESRHHGTAFQIWGWCLGPMNHREGCWRCVCFGFRLRLLLGGHTRQAQAHVARAGHLVLQPCCAIDIHALLSRRVSVVRQLHERCKRATLMLRICCIHVA